MSHKMDKDVSGAILCMFSERKRRECCIYYSRDEDATTDKG